MVQFASVYESSEIVAPLARQLTWSHLLQLIALEDAGERRFYEALAARGRWDEMRCRLVAAAGQLRAGE